MSINGVPADGNRSVRTGIIKIEGDSNRCFNPNYVRVTVTRLVTWYYAFYAYTYLFLISNL